MSGRAGSAAAPTAGRCYAASFGLRETSAVTRVRFSIALPILVVLAAPAVAEDGKPAAPPAAPPAAGAPERAPQKPIPPLATTTEAKEAIAKFKASFKGKDVGVKADAVDTLGVVNHPFVVDELLKVAKHKDAELRAAAYFNLGRQRAIPELVAKALVPTADPKSKDVAHLTEVIDTLRLVGARSATPTLLALCRHEDHGVVRWALDAIGDLKDVRALDEVLALMKELKVEEGVKWDGAEASVDTGTSGDGDQQAAQAAATAAAAANARKGKSSARKMRSAGEILYSVLDDLTGEKFGSGKEARAWLEKHKDKVAERCKALDEEQAKQEADAKAALAAAKAGK